MGIQLTYCILTFTTEPQTLLVEVRNFVELQLYEYTHISKILKRSLQCKHQQPLLHDCDQFGNLEKYSCRPEQISQKFAEMVSLGMPSKVLARYNVSLLRAPSYLYRTMWTVTKYTVIHSQWFRSPFCSLRNCTIFRFPAIPMHGASAFSQSP